MCNIDFSFLNVFKKKKIEIQEWISDIENEKDLTQNKIDFIYNNAIDYMKEIKFGFDKINQKTTLLLSYLSIIIAFLVNKILDNQLIIEYKIFAISIIIIYFFNILYITIKLLNPKLSEAINSEPKNLLNKNNMVNNLEKIKFYALHNMQNRIDKLLIEQDIIVSYLQNSINVTFVLPLLMAILLFGYYNI